MNAMINNNAKTMSSLEIAELTGKNHQHVMRDLREHIETLGRDESTVQFWTVNFIPSKYVADNRQSYDCFNLTKEGSIFLVSGYDAVTRAKLVMRWQELEAKTPVIDFNNPNDLKILLIGQLEKLVAANEQIETMMPKVNAFDRLALASGSMCLTDAAKTLQLHKIKDLTDYMQQKNWIYKRTGKSNYTAYQERIKAGHLEHKITTVSRSDGSEKVVEQVLVTPKGLQILSSVFVQQQLLAA
jgi:Rha family phage regulatory protein